MKFISLLSEADQADLMAVYRSSPSHWQRQHAQAVLLSAKGYTLDQLSDIVGVESVTVSGWLDQWQAHGLPGLNDAPKSGRPRKIDAVVEAHLYDVLQFPTPNLKAALEEALQK